MVLKRIFAAFGRAIRSLFRRRPKFRARPTARYPQQVYYQPPPQYYPPPQPQPAPQAQPAAAELAAEAAMPELAVAETLGKELKKKGEEVKKGIKKGLKVLLYILLIIGIVGIIFWYFVFTTTGAFVSSKAGGLWAPLADGFKKLASPLNQFKMILTGEYDPTEIWESKEYKQQFVPYKDAGVYIEDVKPLRKIFTNGSELVIVGKLKIIAPDDKFPVNVSISADGWDCKPSSISGMRRYTGRFKCTCSPGDGCYTNIDKDFVNVNVNVKADYNFKVTAGKQIYVADPDELDQLYLEGKDPLTYYELSRDMLRSWQTKSPVGLGIGVLGEEEYSIIAANESYYIGFTVKNNGAGLLQEAGAFCVNLPLELNSSINETESDFKYDGVENNMRVIWCAKEGGLKQLKPGEYETRFLSLKIPSDVILKGSHLSSFFVKADFSYTYLDSRAVSLQVKSK